MTKVERARLTVFLREIKVHIGRIERNVRMQIDLNHWVVERKDREIAGLKKKLATSSRGSSTRKKS